MHLHPFRAALLTLPVVSLLMVTRSAGGQVDRQRDLSARQAVAKWVISKEAFVGLAGIRELPDGNVIVNDQGKLQLVLLDSSLTLRRTIADGTPTAKQAYGRRPGGLIPFGGDSTMFVDSESMSTLVIDAKGYVARVSAAPRPKDAVFLLGGYGNPGFDRHGRLVYRNQDTEMRFIPDIVLGAPLREPLTTPLVRLSANQRSIDTVAQLRTSQNRGLASVDSLGRRTVSMVFDPLPIVDEWAVLADGSVAIVRGADYHVDILTPAGQLIRGPKIPHKWARFEDDVSKARFLDSARAALNAARRTPPPQQVEAGTDARSASAPSVHVIPVAEMPDYRPVFGIHGVRSDLDGRVWIRTIPQPGDTAGVVYDVVDRRGLLVDRLRLPSSTAIVGFGRHGNMYLGARMTDGVHLVRMRLSPR